MSTAETSKAPAIGSLRDSLLSLDPETRAALLADCSDEDAAALLYDWRGLWARDAQATPAGDWRTWLILAGRGFGKTRTGAEWVREQVESGKARRIALVARTAADARDVMVEGESGILAISPPWFRPKYEPSKRRLTWPNGAIATTYSGDEPALLRGPQHDAAWADERAAWRYDDAWDQLMFGLRLGQDPRCVVTTTPRPTKAIKELVKDPTTHVTRGSTYDNKANLAKAFLEKIVKKYEGTRLGRQELEAAILEDTEGALWTLAGIEETRTQDRPESLDRIVVGVDPAVTSGESSNETGIVVCGMRGRGLAAEYFVLEDFSIHGTPDEWARRAKTAYEAWSADLIVGEVNNGGDLVEHTLRTVAPHLPYKAVRASRGKAKRAEPISALWEQKRARILGMLAKLEDQMTTWVPGLQVMDDGETSPDRMDAMVWAMTELSGGISTPRNLRAPAAAPRSPSWRTA